MQTSSSTSSLESLIHAHTPFPSHLDLRRSQSHRSDHSSIARNHRARSKSFRKEQRRLRRRSSTGRSPLDLSDGTQSGTLTPCSSFARFRFTWGAPRSALGMLSSGGSRSRSPDSAISPKTLISASSTLEQQLEEAIAKIQASNGKHNFTNVKHGGHQQSKKRRTHLVGFNPSPAYTTLSDHPSTVTLHAPSFISHPHPSAISTIQHTQAKHFPSLSPTLSPIALTRPTTTSTFASTSTRFSDLSDNSVLRRSYNCISRIKIFVDGHWEWVEIERQNSRSTLGTVDPALTDSSGSDDTSSEASSSRSWLQTWVPVMYHPI